VNRFITAFSVTHRTWALSAHDGLWHSPTTVHDSGRTYTAAIPCVPGEYEVNAVMIIRRGHWKGPKDLLVGGICARCLWESGMEV
jgi:hypothetical protein